MYQIIYADPPWNGLGYNNGSGLRAPANHYPVMNENDILSLDVKSLTDPNCALFLWATYPNLPLAIKTIEAWGFRYATQAFTWAKLSKTGAKFHIGCGNYTRANAEVCLLGMKGSLKRQDASVRSLIVEPIRAHSQKPDRVRDDIIKLLGNLPRIELFARTKIAGWDAWGNEVTPETENEKKFAKKLQ